MTSRSRLLRLVAIVAILVLVAAACSKDTGGGSGDTGDGGGGTVEGGTLRVAGGGPDSINPFRATSQESYAYFQYIYPFLVVYNDTYDDFEPDLATSWEVSEDGKDWTFTLREGAQWSDGDALDSSDVKFTFDMMLMKGSGWGSYIQNLDSIEAPDATTVIFHYSAAVSNVLSQLQQVMILPEQVWSPVAKGGVKALKEFPNKAPVVSGGAFTLTKYSEDEFAIFERNENFYGEEPIIDGWGEQFYENSEAEVAALQAGEVDMIWFLDPEGVDPLVKGGYTIDQSPGVEFHDIIINSSKDKVDHLELQDPQVRLALEYATDRQRMIDTAMLGLASSGSSIVPPVTGKWFNSSLEVVPYDIDEANRVLDEAGYTRGSDGIRVSPDSGEKLQWELMSQIGQAGANRVFEILKEDWAKLGIEIKHKPLSYNALWDANQQVFDEKTGIGTYSEFDLIMWSWVPLQDPDFILSVMLCDQLSVWSDTAYCDAEYDEWYNQQGIEMDPKARQDLVWEMQAKIYEDKPYIVLYYLDSIFAYDNSKWDGLLPSPQGPINALNRDSLTQVHQVG